MADKVLRFSAEDSGYGATIDRMAQKLRTAFSDSTAGGGGISELLSEADAKFTSFSDKVKFIRGELSSMKSSNTAEYGDRLAQIDNSKETSATKNYLAGNAEKGYKEEQKSIDRLVDALDKLSDKVENEDKRKEVGGDDEGIVDKVKKSLSGGGSGGNDGGGGGGGGSFSGGLLGGAIGGAIGSLIGNISAQAIGLLKGALQESTNQLKAENLINRSFRYNSDAGGVEQANVYRNLGLPGSEGLQAIRATALSRRRSGGEAEIEKTTNERLYLERGAGIDQSQASALDKLTRYDGNAVNNSSGYDPNRTIIELLQRISKPGGFIDIDSHDFLLAPEKLDQLTQILQSQYARTGETDPNTAINLIAAGQKLGGRFGGNQAGEAYNNIAQGISNPSGDAMTAYINAALHAANPNLDPYELKAQRQKGLGGGNLEAIMAGIKGASKFEKEAFYDNLTGGNNTGDAIKVAKGDKGLLDQLKVQGKTNEEAAAALDKLKKSAEELTTNLDKAGATTKDIFGKAATYFDQFLGNVRNGAAPLDAPYQMTNKTIKTSPVGGK